MVKLATLRRELATLREMVEARSPALMETAPAPAQWAESAAGIQLDDWQRHVLESDEKRLLLLCSRQTGKSEAVALAGAYRAIYQRGARVLVIAPTLRQSRNLFERISHAVHSTEPVPRIIRRTSTHIQFAHGGSVRALPRDSPDGVRGLVASHVVIDEAAFCRDEVLHVVLPMLSTTGGSLTMLSTPSGPSGLFYEAWRDEAGWTRIKVLAANCPRISEEFLRDARRKLGDLSFRQEFLCEFVQASSTFFSAELIRQAFDGVVGEPGYLDRKREPGYL